MTEVWDKAIESGRVRLTKAEEDFLGRSGELTEVVETGGLKHDKAGGKQLPERVTEAVTDGELGEVGGKLLEVGRVIERDGKLGEEGEGRANGAFGADVVSAEEAVGRKLGLELKMDEERDSCPERGGGRFGVEQRVVAGDHDALISHLVLQIDDRQVVIGVVVISSGFAGEAHASQRSELSLNAGLDREMQVNEILRDVETLHFLHLEKDGLTMLGLIEGGVVVSEMDGMGEMSLAPLRKLKGCVPGVDVEVGGAVQVVEMTLVLLNGAESENDGVVHQRKRLACFPRAEE